MRQWRLKNPDIIKDTNLKAAYGENFGLIEFNEMFEKQTGCCAICSIHQSKRNRRLYVDHDHKTGDVRELLCNRCNTALGAFKDSIENMKKAIEYVNKHNGLAESNIVEFSTKKVG